MTLDKIAVGAAAAALLMASTTGADALSLRVSVAGDTTFTVADNEAGNDLNADAGFISYDQDDAGTTKALSGWDRVVIEGGRCTVCAKTMTLSMEATHPGNPGAPLIVEIWDWGFVLDDALSWVGDFAATSILGGGSSIDMTAYWSPNNVAFSKDYQIGETTSLVGADPLAVVGAVTQSTYAAAITQSPYGMTLVFELSVNNQSRTAQAQSEALLDAVPVPAALPLLAGAIGVFGLMRARRRAA